MTSTNMGGPSSRHGSINSVMADSMSAAHPFGNARSPAGTPHRQHTMRHPPGSIAGSVGKLHNYTSSSSVGNSSLVQTPSGGGYYHNNHRNAADTPTPSAPSNDNSSYFVMLPTDWSGGGGGGGAGGVGGESARFTNRDSAAASRTSPWFWQARGQGSSGLLSERNRTPEALSYQQQQQQQQLSAASGSSRSTAAPPPPPPSMITDDGDDLLELRSQHRDAYLQTAVLVGTDAANPFAASSRHQQHGRLVAAARDDDVDSSDYSESSSEVEEDGASEDMD